MFDCLKALKYYFMDFYFCFSVQWTYKQSINNKRKGPRPKFPVKCIYNINFLFYFFWVQIGGFHAIVIVTVWVVNFIVWAHQVPPLRLLTTELQP